MKYYIVPEENAHYYCRRGNGIYRKDVLAKTEPKLILPGGLDGFALYRNELTHIIGAAGSNDIYYIQGGRQPVKIMTGRDGIKPYDFTLTENRGRLILFYKTDYEGETLLFRCAVDEGVKPKLVSALSDGAASYCCAGGRIYYTSAENVLVSRTADARDIGPEEKLCPGAELPCCTAASGRGLLVYKCGNNIAVNGIFTAYDEYIENPVIFISGASLYLQWKSGCFIRYMTSENGSRWSDIKRYIGAGKEPQLLTIARSGGSYLCYGYDGIPFVSGKGFPVNLIPPDEKVRQELTEIKKQVHILKEEIKKINSANFFDGNEKQ
ncbi:MAG: hypothetical protein J6N52_05585 [Clostridia bacterium]|nr:hypothetical protein [Clostridia bacterium]